MKTRWYVLFASWCLIGMATFSAAAELPMDMAAFVERRDACNHFRGEETYDAERAAFVEKKLIELCTGTDKELAQLKEKYACVSELLPKLNEYETQIEPNPL